MDEPSARCNQQAYEAATRLTKSGNDAEVTKHKTFAFTSFKYHSYRTHSFGTTFYWI